jgi:hypothetical protein
MIIKYSRKNLVDTSFKTKCIVLNLLGLNFFTFGCFDKNKPNSINFNDPEQTIL